MNKLLIISVMIGLFFIFSFAIANFFQEEQEEETSFSSPPVFQGPVILTDDEAHFRKTGETIPLEVAK